MPKPLKNPKTGAKRPSTDPNVRVHQLMREHMEKAGETTTPPHGDTFEEQFKARMAELGRKGGKASGAKRMENLSEKQRRDIALKAAKARWNKGNDR
jgi:general stress protein YciG